jgi:hypothetical protein
MKVATSSCPESVEEVVDTVKMLVEVKMQETEETEVVESIRLRTTAEMNRK